MTVNSVINSLENKVLDDILKPINHPVSRIPGLEFDSEYATIDDFEAFFSYYKEKELPLMHKEYETLKSFLEERNKKEESFLTGMTEVLKTYQWDAVKMLGTLTTIKYGIKNIFA